LYIGCDSPEPLVADDLAA
jgi:hypothetical protein